MNTTCKSGRSDLQAYNPQGFDLAEGDEVEIEIPGIEQAKSAFWILGLPVLALFAGYGLGCVFFGAVSEGPAIASGGALFALTLAAGLLVQKRRKTDSLPRITRKCGA
jgi:positive regulator of sigma E activity